MTETIELVRAAAILAAVAVQGALVANLGSARARRAGGLGTICLLIALMIEKA